MFCHDINAPNWSTIFRGILFHSPRTYPKLRKYPTRNVSKGLKSKKDRPCNGKRKKDKKDKQGSENITQKT